MANITHNKLHVGKNRITHILNETKSIKPEWPNFKMNKIYEQVKYTYTLPINMRWR